MTPAKSDEHQPTRDEMIAHACALIPKLKDRAAETEQLRRIHPDTVQDLHDTGLWRLHQPVRYGGVELDYALYIDIGEALARGCASTSWVWANLVSHNWMLAMFDQAAQDEVWNRDNHTLIGSGLIYPCGKVDRVDGGYQLSGRWPFSSGIDPSSWVMLGGMVPAAEGEDAPTPRIFVVEKSDIEVIDTWDVAGLVGTGSKDVACENVFVPEHMTLNPRDGRGGPTPGSAVNKNPIYRLPILALFPHIIAGTVLGIARGAYDDFVGEIRKRTATYNKSKLAEHTTIQLRIAEAGALIDAARLLLHSNCREAADIAEANDDFTDDDKTRWRRDGAYAAGMCAKAVDVIYAAAGGGANYRRNPLQRHFRDVHAGVSHIGVAWDVNGAEFGRTAVGLPHGNPNV
jgi:3-hydroxy-9,10-secoandrosta-1,3,5(10)-triene-9,17-dione monooxygenase